MRRRALGWTAALLAVAFLIVLAVPGTQRALALYAFLLLVGAIVLAGLVALVAAAPVAGEALLEGPAAAPERRPAELDTIEQEVRELIATGAIEDRLRVQVRAIALSRLARHGIADPAAAESLLGESPLGRIVAPRQPGRTRPRISPAELGAAVEELERL